MQTAGHIVDLHLAETDQLALIEGARDSRPVNGLTHNFYRYPARFSPSFVRSALEVFTSPGDTVLDPYMGGGTSLVEALALGRNAVGIDISELAEFVTQVKTTVLAESDLAEIIRWSEMAVRAINVRAASITFSKYQEHGYYKHLDAPSRWRFRHAIEQALETAMRLDSPKLEAFARCIILRTAQWALDGRRVLPRLADFRKKLIEGTAEMVEGAREFATSIGASPLEPTALLINRPANQLLDVWDRKRPAPKLVVTSPPYPGVHVLYHRWQVDGRKESAAPFWIANKLDGAGASYYTMGDRKSHARDEYFRALYANTAAVAQVSDHNTIFVQMVAFSNPDQQLPRYLQTMADVGLEELVLPMLMDEADGRLWRDVPNRRWYVQNRRQTAGSREVVLFHRKRSGSEDEFVTLPSEASEEGLDIKAQ